MFKDLKYKNNGSELSVEELEKINSFFLALSQNKLRTRIIFRGENYQSLKEKFSLNGNSDFNKLNAIIFQIGAKGRVYRDEYKKKIKNKNKIHAIDSVETNLFKYIFHKINYILSKKKNREEIKQFKCNNKDIDDYFLDKNKMNDFLTKVSSSKNNQEKIRIRDYYLNLLHQVGGIGFYNNSFFLSTSTDIKVAEKFSAKFTNSEKIIFISWVNYPINKIGISFNYLNKLSSKLLNMGLPTYSKSFFPKQKEVSIKGGLLPHYILGYIRPEKKELILNPNLFTTNKDFNGIIKNGFDIDQTNFKKFLNKTDYSGYFILDENNIYSDFNNKKKPIIE